MQALSDIWGKTETITSERYEFQIPDVWRNLVFSKV